MPSIPSSLCLIILSGFLLTPFFLFKTISTYLLSHWEHYWWMASAVSSDIIIVKRKEYNTIYTLTIMLVCNPYSFITENYIAPLQGYYSEALPIPERLKRTVLPYLTRCILATAAQLASGVIRRVGLGLHMYVLLFLSGRATQKPREKFFAWLMGTNINNRSERRSRQRLSGGSSKNRGHWPGLDKNVCPRSQSPPKDKNKKMALSLTQKHSRS